jgi:MoaA/NifB/PqqE/SkfB family radical SAM enzyme
MSVSRLQVASRFVRHRFAKLHVFEVQAVLLNDCNLRCSYCACPDLGGQQMTTEQWLDLIARFRAAGTLRIKWQGGEPTIRRDFALLCEAVRSHGIICAVVTNGIAIARNPALLTHLDEVVVSLDAATPASHDRHRGNGTHALAVRAIDEARARGRRVYVNMVVTNDSVSEVPTMLEFCEQRKVGLNVQPAMFSRTYQRREAMHLGLSPSDEHALERQLAQWRRERRPLMFAAETYERAARWPDYTSPTTSSAETSACMAGRFYVHIEPNGDVFPCVLQGSPGYVARNLIQDGFETALLHAREHHCTDCFLPYLNERKALFALRPAAVLAWIKRG